MKTIRLTFLAAGAILMAAGTVRSQSIPVPNGLFAQPATSYQLPYVVSWQTVPPAEDQEVGVFTNNPAYGPGEYIVNCVGGQAAFLYAAHGTALFQDYDSVDALGDSNTFSATFTPGLAYRLTTGITGDALEQLTPGVVLQMSLYYRDSSGNMITVGATNIVYSTNVFHPTNFVNCELDTSAIPGAGGAAGRHIGIEFVSLANGGNQGGFWDLNNVQLLAFSPTAPTSPTLTSPSWTNGQFRATVNSQPGLAVQILASTNLSVSLTNWTSLVTLTNVSGTTNFTDAAATLQDRFYRARQLP